jgi:hypothetical protein
VNPWVHRMFGIFWLAEELVASEEGLCSMELVMMFCYTVLQPGRPQFNPSRP